MNGKRQRGPQDRERGACAQRLASRAQAPRAGVRRAVMAYAVFVLLAGRVQVNGTSCDPVYTEDSTGQPCVGTFYLSTDTAGGHKDAVLWADTWYGQALVSRNNEFRALLQSDGNFVIYRQSDGAALWSANTHCQYDCSSATDSRSPNHGSGSHGTTT